MSTFWKKITDIATESKKACIEQIWLIALLGPLLILAGLGLNRLHDDPAKHDQDQVEQQFFTTVSEISSTEVAVIIAKPIGELLTMQVYFDGKRRRDKLVANLSVDDVFRNGMSNEIIAYQSRRNYIGTLAYSDFLKNKKIQLSAERT